MNVQLIRIIDVFLYAPALLYIAGKQPHRGVRRIMEVMALTTLLYNGYNLARQYEGDRRLL